MQAPPARAAGRRRRSGFTFLELLVVMLVMGVAVTMFTSMVSATARQRGINRENAIAANAARVAIELMRNEDTGQVFALYNEDPADDPGGPGTAPGHLFAVPGLDPLPDAEGGVPGRIFMPSLPVEIPGEGGAESSVAWQLREDVEDERMGMPRDLNGDSIIDAKDHAGDYILLPVRVRIEWRGRHGPRSLDVFTMLAAMNH